MVQILILAVVAAFLFWRLSIVLGTRSGFEKTADIKVRDIPKKQESIVPSDQEVDLDEDEISDYVELSSEPGQALKKIKKNEPNFSISNFVSGAKSAYELILMAYEKGDLDTLEMHLEKNVFKDFEAVVTERADKGYNVEAKFIGLREIRIKTAFFDEKKNVAEITVFFKCELTSIVRDKDDNIIEGSPSEIRTHTDLWTFGRLLGTQDPSWKLIATGD